MKSRRAIMAKELWIPPEKREDNSMPALKRTHTESIVRNDMESINESRQDAIDNY